MQQKVKKSGEKKKYVISAEFTVFCVMEQEEYTIQTYSIISINIHVYTLEYSKITKFWNLKFLYLVAV